MNQSKPYHLILFHVISHAFDLFLYPDPAFRSQIYSAAGIDVFWFDVLVVLTTAIIVAGWVLTYYSEQNRLWGEEQLNNLWLSFYALISREFYLTDLYAWLTRATLKAAARMNELLRWR